MYESSSKNQGLRQGYGVVRWCVWGLLYWYIPAYVLQWVTLATVGLDDTYLLFIVRLLLLIGLVAIVPKAERRIVKRLLWQPCTVQLLGWILLLFSILLLVGLLGFGWLEQTFQLTSVPDVSVEVPKTVTMWVLVGILAPVIEEGWFRYWLLPLQLPNGVGVTTSAWYSNPSNWLYSTLVFGLLHATPNYAGIKACIWAWVMGVFLVWVRYKTNNLSLCILLHAIHNILVLWLLWGGLRNG